MNAQDLKSSILQIAIEGKLVKQKIEEGNSKQLVRDLRRSKIDLVQRKKIYKKKETKPFYKADNLPFDIPESWNWVQLSEVSIIQEGAGIRKYQYQDSGTQLLCVTNILEGKIDLNKKKIFISDSDFNNKYRHLKLMNGDIVTACSGGSWGKVAIYNSNRTTMLNTSTLRLRFFDDLGCNRYLYYVTQSNFFKNQLKNQLVGIQPNFGYAHYSRIMIPLPPFKEQKRIVEKIEELMPYVYEYDKSQTEIEKLNNEFPEEIQKSVLKYAMEGKLVNRQENEETAEVLYKKIQEEKNRLINKGKIKKKKPQPEVSEEEVPFEIPETWVWKRLGHVANLYNGNSISKNQKINKYEKVSSGYDYIGTKDVMFDSSINYDNGIKIPYEENNFKIAYKNSTLLCIEGGSAGRKIGLLDKNVCFGNKLCSVNTIYGNYKYMYYYLRSPVFYKQFTDSMNGIIGGVGINKLKNICIPIPPLDEQNRIVDKIEELLVITNRLSNKILT